MRLPHTLTAREHATASPLWLVSNEPLVNDLVEYLDAMRRDIEAAPNRRHTFEFSRSTLQDVRAAFARLIRHGEGRLHRFCELACDTFFDGRYALQSVAVTLFRYPVRRLRAEPLACGLELAAHVA